MKSALVFLAAVVFLAGCASGGNQAAWGNAFQAMGQSIQQSNRQHEQNLKDLDDSWRQARQDELMRQQTEYYRNQNQKHWLNQ